MALHEQVKRFFFPSMNRRYALRIFILAAVAFVVFGYVLTPFVISGESMAPTYGSRGVTFGWKMAYTFSDPQRGDVVIISVAGSRVALLKRIVALPGEEVEFRDGVLLIDGEELDEPYVVKSSDWELPPRVVDEDHYYVVGDNRSMPIEHHHFGQVNRNRITGRPLW